MPIAPAAAKYSGKEMSSVAGTAGGRGFTAAVPTILGFQPPGTSDGQGRAVSTFAIGLFASSAGASLANCAFCFFAQVRINCQCKADSELLKDGLGVGGGTPACGVDARLDELREHAAVELVVVGRKR